MSENYISHHGIKGMKWGRRRYQNKDGSLTPAGIKRYSEKGYSDDAYKSNKSDVGMLYDKFTGAHKTAGKIRSDLSSQKEREARANAYVSEKRARKGFSEDAYNSNKLPVGKWYDKATGAHKIAGDIRYEMASQKERDDRAKKYAKDQEAKEDAKTDFINNRQNIKAKASKGEKIANKILGSGYANGYASARASGYGKGKSVAVGLLAGELGSMRIERDYVRKKTS